MQYSTKWLAKWCLAIWVGFFGAILPLRADPAAASLLDDWYWHAFFSQGLVYTSDNHFAGPSDDDISTDFTEVGLIVGGHLSDEVQVVAQVLSHNLGAMSDGSLQLDYGFVSYQLLSDWDRSVGVKVGRVRSPYGFFNETRDAAHTRNSILLPQSIYMDRLRNLIFARDGVQLFGSVQSGKSLLSWDLVYGEIQINEEYLSEVTRDQRLPGKVDVPYQPMARLIWDWDAGRARLGVTYHPLKYRYKAAVTDLYNSGMLEFGGWIFSTEYNTAAWTLIGEYAITKSELDEILSEQSPRPLFNNRAHSYYLQGIYRFMPGWDVFVRYDGARVKLDQSGMRDIRAEGFSMGVGWKPSPRWLLRAEWHKMNGIIWLSTRENPEGWLNPSWQMVLFQVSYRI